MSEQTRIAHTPGPWEFELYPSGGFEIESATGSESGGLLVIASRNSHTNVETMHANARLIASAPDLLEALSELVAHLDEHDERNREPECPVCIAVVAARAAIAKATGDERALEGK